MPRLKVVNKKGGGDPMYKQTQKVDPEPAPVRSGGRIKKAKTIFDPSDSGLSAKQPTTPGPPPPPPLTGGSGGGAAHNNDPERRTPSRRYSVSTSVTTMSAYSNGTPPSSTATSTISASTIAVRKRKIEAAPPLPPSAPSTANASPARGPTVTAVAPKTPTRIITVIPAAQSGANKTLVTIPKSSQVSLIKTTAAAAVTTAKNASNGPSTAQRVSVPTAMTKKRFLSFRCAACDTFDNLEVSLWTKCSHCTSYVHNKCVEPQSHRGQLYACPKCALPNCTECKHQVPQEEAATCNKCASVFHVDCVAEEEDDEEPRRIEWECKACRLASRANVRRRRLVTNEGGDGESKSGNNKSKAAVPSARNSSGAGKAGGKAKVATGDGRPAGAGAASRFWDPANSTVPDASKWSAQDVYDFLADRFPKEAAVFLEQEIDGVSLLLMRRADVINGLGFKLGPALRIYKQIIMLQTRDTDPTLTWY